MARVRLVVMMHSSETRKHQEFMAFQFVTIKNINPYLESNPIVFKD